MKDKFKLILIIILLIGFGILGFKYYIQSRNYKEIIKDKELVDLKLKSFEEAKKAKIREIKIEDEKTQIHEERLNEKINNTRNTPDSDKARKLAERYNRK